MMKTLLIPTDFSDNAFIASQYGAHLASKLGYKVLFYNAYIVLYAGFEEKGASVQQIEWADEEATKGMKSWIEKLKSYYPNLEIEGKCERGFLVDAIKDELKEDSSIIGVVMGSKGATNLSETLFGSTTYAVIKNSDIPVLVVPSNTPDFKLEKAGYFTGLNDHDATALNTMNDFLALDSEKLFIHLSSQSKEELRVDLQDWKTKLGELDYVKTADVQVVNSDRSWLSINIIAAGMDLDLLVFSRPQKPFFKQLFHRSLTKEISNHPILPTLIIPVKD